MPDGTAFEVRAYDAIKKAVNARDLGLDPEQCRVLFHPSYYSRDRGKDICVDVAIELYASGQTDPSIIWVWECKDYSHPLPVDAVEEFHAKLEQIGADRTKGTVITSGVLQSSALTYAVSKGIGVARLLPDNCIRMGHPITAKGMFRAAEMIRSAEQGGATEELRCVASEEVEEAVCDPAFKSWTRSFYGLTPTGLVEPAGDLTQYVRMELMSLGAIPSVTIPCGIDGRPLLAGSFRYTTPATASSLHPIHAPGAAVDADRTLARSEAFQGCLRVLQGETPTNVVVGFDATVNPSVTTGWPATYAVVVVTIRLPEQADQIARNIYDNALQLCRMAHAELQRERTFYDLRFVQGNGDRSYSTSVFLDNTSTVGTTSAILYEKASLLFRLWCTCPAFKAMYCRLPVGFLHYSKSHQRILGIPSRCPFDFSGRFPKYLDILSDQLSHQHLSLSGQYLGNVGFLAGSLQEAIAEWMFSLEHGETVDAYFNIACAYSKLGDMVAACQYCREAVKRNIDPALVLGDPDLQQFRMHPLYHEVLDLMGRAK